VEEHGDACSKCGSTMIARRGKTGRYAKCASETCGQVVSLEPPKFQAEPCPSCGNKVREQPYTKDGKRKVLFVCQAECGWKSGFAPPKTGKEPCPKCGGVVLRSGSKGEFFGCLSYPKCDGARSIPKHSTRRQR
jgi:ssDNA-binding Zn-finger/Zn-ribbon topoisomerase 1